MDDRTILRQPVALSGIEDDTRLLGFGMGGERMVGSLLRTLAKSKGKGRFLELGTGTGLSTAWILDGMSQDSTLVTVDNDRTALDVAERHLGNDPRLKIVCEDGDRFIVDLSANGARFDFIFADTWSGKYRLLLETLDLLDKNGFYVIDDMLPQTNWPEGQSLKVKDLLESLDGNPELQVTKLGWSSGVVVVTKD